MTKYLVDYENVKCDGLLGIDKLYENDEVLVFYSINADRITFDLHNMINTSKAKIKFYNIDVGSKNALDFQLSTYLGYLIAANKEEKFVIVTKDKDYSVVVSFWKKMNVDISIKNDLVILEDIINPVYFVEDEEEKVETKPIEVKEEKKNKKNPRKKKPSKTTKKKSNKNDEIKVSDPSLTTEIFNLVNDQHKAILLASYIEKYKTKLGVNNAIVKEYGTTIGGQLYKTIKPLISDKKGN